MSKSSKAKTKNDNLQKKRALKAANKAKYETWRRLGENTKSRRVTIRGRKKRGKDKGKHLIADCGNIACKKCYTHTKKGVYPIGRLFSIRGADARIRRAA